MSNAAPPTLALTVGEPAGIGPDLTAMLAADPPPDCRLVAIGDPAVIEARAAVLGVDAPLTDFAPRHAKPTRGIEIVAVPTERTVSTGRLDPANAASVLATLNEAADGCLAGRYDAVVTAPVHKGVINDAGIAFSGHTEYFAERTGGAMPVMMLVAGDLRVALATTHLPLRAVADALTRERLEAVARILDADLRTRFGIARPRVLVAGLNPHAGEGGHLGHEETQIIEPVLDSLRRDGLDLVGPLPADTLFTPQHLEGADAVLAMYHDQGLPVLKHAGFGEAVNVTLGLPIVRTSVDHGTALDLAGSGRARDGSLRAAVGQAAALARRARAARTA
ncbi:4-hydroxythreonine-4-phosphate dehydrogenase PdxA [Arhodomonas sp. AD133]|uniref:4-hydroxythreonine-4-phosphate dehydrogenase PdxA n=1 Tax=Arhodomonas sp. AD133 TaxID=3415009 RepID=UPI003EBA7CFD